jgi:hypothetical protein
MAANTSRTPCSTRKSLISPKWELKKAPGWRSSGTLANPHGAVSRGPTCSQESGYAAVNLKNLKSGSGRSLFSITRAYRTRVEPSPLRQVKPKKRFIGESKIGDFEKALLRISKENCYERKGSARFCQTKFRIGLGSTTDSTCEPMESTPLEGR